MTEADRKFLEWLAMHLEGVGKVEGALTTLQIQLALESTDAVKRLRRIASLS